MVLICIFATQVAKIATFPTSLIYCDAVIKQLCYYDEKLTDAAFVKPINLAQVKKGVRGQVLPPFKPPFVWVLC